jgi:hypothetical protein
LPRPRRLIDDADHRRRRGIAVHAPAGAGAEGDGGQLGGLRLPAKQTGALRSEEPAQRLHDPTPDIGEVERLGDGAAELGQALGRAPPALGVLEMDGVGDGDGGLAGEQSEQPLLLLGEAPARLRQHHQHTDDLSGRQQRPACEAVEVAVGGESTVQQARVLGDVLYIGGLARLEDPADEATAIGDRHVLAARRIARALDAERALEAEHAMDGVVDPDAGRAGVEQDGRRARHLGEERGAFRD